MNSKFEKYYPIILSFALTIISCSFLYKKNLPNSLTEIFSAATTLSSILAGFLTTAISIIFSINDTKVLERLKRLNGYTRLVNYFMGAIKWAILLAILSFMCLFLDLKYVEGWKVFCFGLWLFSLLMSLLTFYRIVDVFADILHSTAKN